MKLNKLLLSLTLLMTCIISTNNVSALTYNNKIVLISNRENINITTAKNTNDLYSNIDVMVMGTDSLNINKIDSTDLLCVDIDALYDTNIKNYICDELDNREVMFLGPSNIDYFSDLLRLSMERKSIVYDLTTGDLLTNNMVNLENNEFTVLKYTENEALKKNIQLIDMEDDISFSCFLIPCFDALIENNQPAFYSTTLTSSYTHRAYFFNSSTNAQQSNYLNTTIKIYKVNSETDNNYDYYILEQNTYFKEVSGDSTSTGHYLAVRHNSASSNIVSCTDAKPTNSSGTTSYSFSVGITGADLSISYSGPKAKISLTRNGLINDWVIQDATVGNNANFNSGDSFEFASEYKVTQGGIPTFKYRVYALDKGIGKVNYITRTCSAD